MIVFNENILNTSRYKNILHNLKGQGQLKSMFAIFFSFPFFEPIIQCMWIKQNLTLIKKVMSFAFTGFPLFVYLECKEKI